MTVQEALDNLNKLMADGVGADTKLFIVCSSSGHSYEVGSLLHKVTDSNDNVFGPLEDHEGEYVQVTGG